MSTDATPRPNDALPARSARAAGDAPLRAGRDLPVGGQAVLEGVMMRGVSTWAVAVRKPTEEQLAGGELALGAQADEGVRCSPDRRSGCAPPRSGEHRSEALESGVAAEGDIEVSSEPVVSIVKRHRALRLPVIRGTVALVESMRLGLKALGISASARMPDGDGGERQEIGSGTWAGTVAFALLFAVGLFFLLPATLTNLFEDSIPSSIAFVVIEKLVRISIFVAYILLISRMRDLRRVFQYHGAEHKTISCYEAGLDLTPCNAQRFSRLHPRCGTSFLLIVMIVAVFVFAPLGKLDWHWLLISRVVGIPIVAGLAFEVIKWLGRNRTKRWARVLMWPGLQLQRLTTREPELAQLAVAIAALEAVLAVEDPADATRDDRAVMEVGA